MNHTVNRLLAVLMAFFLLCPVSGRSEDETHPVVCITIRDYGKIYAELYPEYAPVTVENFLNLMSGGFYDGLTFHRIIKGFMMQGGDPLGNGAGGSPQKIKGEFTGNGVDNPLTHERGVLSMARSRDMNSASSQFFIMHKTSPHLDGQYAAFGRVLAGQWVVDRICQETPVQDSNGTVLKEDQPVMESVRFAERAEAEAAARQEAENGKSGTMFEDYVSPLSFLVPEGWNKTAESEASVTFLREGAADKPLMISRQNYWDSLSAAYKQQLAANGLSRQALDTAAFRRESLAGLIGLDASLFRDETHSGVSFLTAEAPSADAVYYVGARGGVIYVISFGGARSDALFPEVEGILDSLTFREID